MAIARFVLLLVMAASGLMACQSAPASPSPAVIRSLATVAISPTPNASQRAATLAFVSPTPAAVIATLPPSSTAYVGVFLGEALVSDAGDRLVGAAGESATSAPPTADADACSTAIADPFVSAWAQQAPISDRLGCPIQISFEVAGSVQVFQSGVMYWREDTEEVWAIVSRRFELVSRYTYVEDPDPISTRDLLPSEPGLIVPTGDFGSVWAAVDGLADDLGFALTEANEASLTLQRFAGGTFIEDQGTGQVYALVVDGTSYGPF